jgi:hypothetical protein
MQAFQTFFHGRMGPLEIACLKSFIDHGHEILVFSYDHETTPAFCRREDASAILPREQLFVYESGFGAGSVAAFANMFRYALLYKHGGIWIDTDMFCLSAEWPEENLLAGWQHDNLINCAVLKLDPGHAISEAAYSQCAALKNDVLWGQTGPKLLTQLFEQHGLSSEALPPSAFYPVRWEHWIDTLDPAKSAAVRELTKESFAIHLWNELFRHGGVQKAVAPPRTSFLHDLLVKHDTLRYFTEGCERTWKRQIQMNLGSE